MSKIVNDSIDRPLAPDTEEYVQDIADVVLEDFMPRFTKTSMGLKMRCPICDNEFTYRFLWEALKEKGIEEAMKVISTLASELGHLYLVVCDGCIKGYIESDPSPEQQIRLIVETVDNKLKYDHNVLREYIFALVSQKSWEVKKVGPLRNLIMTK